MKTLKKIFYQYDLFIIILMAFFFVLFTEEINLQSFNQFISFEYTLIHGYQLGILLVIILKVKEFKALENELYMITFSLLCFFYVIKNPLDSEKFDLITVFALITAHTFLNSFYHYRQLRRKYEN